MVQGHTVSALVREGELSGALGRLHALVHGLTAPAFLFGAGLAFGVTTYARYSEHHRGGAALGQRLRRYGWLVLIGYALQLPGGSLWSAFDMRSDTLAVLFQVGPLHLIAATLTLCQLSALKLASPRAHALFCFLFALAILAVTAPLWKSGASAAFGPFVAPWLDNQTGSQFPAFPWASFALLGVAFGGLIRERPSLAKAASLLTVGALLALSSYLAFELHLVGFEARWFWHTSPAYLVFRLGLVIALLGVLSFGSARVVARGSGTLARQSLVAYVAHLLVLYGTPWTPSLTQRFGASLTLQQALLAFVIVFAITLFVAHAWEWLSRERLRTFRWLQATLTVLSMLALMR